MVNYVVPTTPSDDQLLARSNYLMSLGLDPYKDVSPKTTRMSMIPSCKYFFNF